MVESAKTVSEFADDLVRHGGDPSRVVQASIDMSAALSMCIRENLPNAELTFDKIHVVALASKALDETRRIEQKLDPRLEGLRWTAAQGPQEADQGAARRS